MYLSTNARGCVEAALFFLSWAVVGSIFVGLAVLYVISIAGTTSFFWIRWCSFTSDEIFLLYTLTFFGFGTKLSLWPFWYWLPRAHVEVSTGMSVFLSCILIKVCLYCLMRFWWLINSEVVVSPFIFLIALCAFDVTCRLIVQTDLKAIIAYGSVLHVNLLALLILLDTSSLSLGTVLYIWGHSLATAGLFFATSVIERCHGSRSTFEISGIYNTNPLVGILTVFAVVGFLDFPLTIFFWGELWLWITAFSTIPAASSVLMFISAAVYIIIFFRIWWGVLFGASSRLASRPLTTLTWNDLHTAIYLILPQYIAGWQPNMCYLFLIS
jgi:NADH:ubiquinone oxidoreductase subunit 4 (subunit M)